MEWKRAALLYLILTLASPSGFSTSTAALVSVKPLALARIASFSVSPVFTSQNQFIDFSVVVENAGNLAVNATPFITIYSPSNNTVSNITFLPAAIEVGNNATFVSSWSTDGHPLGWYRAVAIARYANTSTGPVEVEFKIQAVTPPPAGGGGGGGTVETPGGTVEGGGVEQPVPEELLPELPPLTPPPVQPLGEGRIMFVKYPVMKEVRPGVTETADIVVSNIGAGVAEAIEFEVEGVPREWIDFKAEPGDLEPGGERGINMVFTIPAGAFPGNYRVAAMLHSGGSSAKTFFILRVLPYPVELERPVVARSVSVDMESSMSTVALKVENAGRFIRRLELVEEIPKDIAGSVDDVDFTIPPTQVLKADPVVEWRMEDIDFYETRRIAYKIPATPVEFEPYVNWPLRQVNIFYEISPPAEGIEISSIETSSLYPGSPGELGVRLENKGVVPLNATLFVSPPAGWEAEPESYALTLAPSSAEALNFTITPADDVSLGVYTVMLRLEYEGVAETRAVSMFVGRREEGLEIPLVALLIALLLLLFMIGYLVRRIYRRRRKVYREDVVSTVDRLREEIMGGRLR